MAKEKVTATAAMREVLTEEGKPLPVKEIVERTLAKPGVALKGKTPGATIAAKLAVSNKDGGEFERTAPGVYGLRAGAKPKAEPKQEAKDEGDEFSTDLKEAAAAADRKAAKPHPKPSAKREKAGAKS